jgi:hypothetical protein
MRFDAMIQTSKISLKDRRGAPRSRASLSAYLLTQAGSQLRGVAINLSRSGLFLETQVPTEWLVGETARLVLTLSDGKIVRLARYSVLIVREVQSGVGLAFWRSLRPKPIQS